VIGEEDLEGLPGAPSASLSVTATAPAAPPPAASLKDAVEDLERRMIQQALSETRNNQQQAARLLGLSRQGLINKMKRYATTG